MIRLFAAFVVLVGLALASVQPAHARQDDPKLGDLFDLLYDADHPREIAAITHLIWQVWSKSGSDTTDYLFKAGIQAMAQGELEKALTRFSAITDIDPEFAEAWNKRATVLFMMGEYKASVVDVQKTVSLEPRHFGAWSGLGMIYMHMEYHELALKAFRRALAANPHLTGAKQQIIELKSKISGNKT
jgi:tetratricopeptide (TPR) repeat protein